MVNDDGYNHYNMMMFFFFRRPQKDWHVFFQDVIDDRF